MKLSKSGILELNYSVSCHKHLLPSNISWMTDGH